MSLLLDTHALIWWSLGDPKLAEPARKAIDDRTSSVFVSAVSIWEISIKFSLGKLPEAGQFIADLQAGKAIEGFGELAVTREHALRAGLMDVPHKDPFDRLLIAQAQLEGLSLVSNERLFDRFGVIRVWD